MEIRKAGIEDTAVVAELAMRLWPGHPGEELAAELALLLTSPKAVVFLAMLQGEAAGFAQCQMRTDYVEGTNSSPVGYLEGIFVKEAFRRQGIARALNEKAEAWAKGKGCLEFASDTSLDNASGIAFHQKAGFKEANRIVCFVKNLTEK